MSTSNLSITKCVVCVIKTPGDIHGPTIIMIKCQPREWERGGVRTEMLLLLIIPDHINRKAHTSLVIVDRPHHWVFFFVWLRQCFHAETRDPRGWRDISARGSDNLLTVPLLQASSNLSMYTALRHTSHAHKAAIYY